MMVKWASKTLAATCVTISVSSQETSSVCSACLHDNPHFNLLTLAHFWRPCLLYYICRTFLWWNVYTPSSTTVCDSFRILLWCACARTHVCSPNKLTTTVATKQCLTPTAHFLCPFQWWLNPLTPNDDYSGCTAPLTSKRCILYIYSTNIGTEYFKHGIYSPFFPLQNAVCFINLTYLVPVLFTFYIEVC